MLITSTHTIAMALMAGPARPRLHGAVARVVYSPRRRRRLRQLSQTGITYARYRVIVLIDVTTEYAAAYTVMTTASALVTTIAQTGVRSAGCTRLSRRAPGMPSSRANAYHIRAIDVIDASPHSHMATPMTTATTWPSIAGRLP